MPEAIIHSSKVLLTNAQKDSLRSLFGSPAYGLLKQIIAARATAAMIDSLNTGLHSDVNEAADELSKAAMQKARQHSRALDILDELQQKPDDCFTVNLAAGQ